MKEVDTKLSTLKSLNNRNEENNLTDVLKVVYDPCLGAVLHSSGCCHTRWALHEARPPCTLTENLSSVCITEIDMGRLLWLVFKKP